MKTVLAALMLTVGVAHALAVDDPPRLPPRPHMINKPVPPSDDGSKKRQDDAADAAAKEKPTQDLHRALHDRGRPADHP